MYIINVNYNCCKRSSVRYQKILACGCCINSFAASFCWSAVLLFKRNNNYYKNVWILLSFSELRMEWAILIHVGIYFVLWCTKVPFILCWWTLYIHLHCCIFLNRLNKTLVMIPKVFFTRYMYVLMQCSLIRVILWACNNFFCKGCYFHLPINYYDQTSKGINYLNVKRPGEMVHYIKGTVSWKPCHRKKQPKCLFQFCVLCRKVVAFSSFL